MLLTLWIGRRHEWWTWNVSARDAVCVIVILVIKLLVSFTSCQPRTSSSCLWLGCVPLLLWFRDRFATQHLVVILTRRVIRNPRTNIPGLLLRPIILHSYIVKQLSHRFILVVDISRPSPSLTTLILLNRHPPTILPLSIFPAHLAPILSHLYLKFLK